MCHLYYLRVFEQAGQRRLNLLSALAILKVYAQSTALQFDFASLFLIPKARKKSQIQIGLILRNSPTRILGNVNSAGWLPAKEG